MTEKTFFVVRSFEAVFMEKQDLQCVFACSNVVCITAEKECILVTDLLKLLLLNHKSSLLKNHAAIVDCTA